MKRALFVTTLLSSLFSAAFADAQQTPAPPSGSVLESAPAATTTTPAAPPSAKSSMPAIDFGFRGSLGGLWLARAQGHFTDNDAYDAFALGMNNNGLGASVGVGLMPNERRGYGIMLRGAYVVGQTSLDLETHFASIGADFLLKVMPDLSLVPSVRGDWLLIKRVTQSDAPDIQHWGYGAGLGLDYTFLRFSEASFFARPGVEGTIIPHALFQARSGLLSGVLTIGIRYLPD